MHRGAIKGKTNRLWMQDGALAGARFDGAIDTTTDYKTGTIAPPALSANDSDTAANELRTHLIVTGSAADGNEGMFSLGELLGAGMATDQGSRYVASAHDTISKVRSDVAALLALATPPSGLDGILETQWSKLEAALDTVFKTSSALDTGATSAVRLTAPREEDILDEIDDILDALASEDAFVAATAAGGGGVFASQELGTGAATDAFNRVQWSATATMGTTGATRYGTAIRKTTANARDGLSTAEVGAFSYSTMAETLRTSLAAAVSLTGIASYTGGTEAISGGGTAYSGTMDLQVRFAANTVSGVVKDLLDADGMPWQHNFADVERIVLTDATLRRNATFTGSGSGTDGATVFFTADSGLLRPITGLQNTLSGILLGTGADAGTQANGVWSVNASGSTNFLTGGFGVMHVGDASRPRPEGDTGGSSNAKLITTATAAGVTTPGVTVADGKLTVKVQRYGYVRSDNETPDDPSDDTVTYVGRTNDGGAAVLATAAFDLEALAGAGAGAKTTVNGPTHVAGVKATLQAQRDQIATLQSLGTRTASTRGAEAAAWQIVQDAIQYQLLREQIPVKLADAYDESEALDLIDRAIDALSNTTTLFAALDPDGTGVFDHYVMTADTDPSDNVDDAVYGDFIHYEAGVDRRWETIGSNGPQNNGRALANVLGEKEYQMFASLGTTNYTRFGIWYRLGSKSAMRGPSNQQEGNHTAPEGGPGAFAYSPLDPTIAGTVTNPAFPLGGSARYVGEAVAHMHTDVLTGTAMVDVSWAAVAESHAAAALPPYPPLRTLCQALPPAAARPPPAPAGDAAGRWRRSRPSRRAARPRL